MRTVNKVKALEAGRTARIVDGGGSPTALASAIKIQAVAPRLLGLKLAAGYVSLSYWTVREMIWRGELPSVRVGRRILVDREDLDDFIERNKQVES